MTPRGGPPGAGVGDPPLPIPPDAVKSSEDVVKALKLLQNVMTKEDFSMYMRRWSSGERAKTNRTISQLVFFRTAETEQLYQGKRMIGGIGDMLFSIYSHT